MTKYTPDGPDANKSGTYTAEFLRVKQQAERGIANAQHSLGFMYFNGQGVAQSYELAVVWYRQAAMQGLEHAQYNLGWLYAKGQGLEADTQKAMHWFSKAAEQGDAGAQNNLGMMYDLSLIHI